MENHSEKYFRPFDGKGEKMHLFKFSYGKQNERYIVAPTFEESIVAFRGQRGNFDGVLDNDLIRNVQLVEENVLIWMSK